MNVFKRKSNFRLWRVKFKKLTEEWLLYKKHKIKESTYLNYTYIINTYLGTKFKKKRLSYFLRCDINEYVDSLEKNYLIKLSEIYY